VYIGPLRRNAESLTAVKFHDAVAVALLDAPNEVLQQPRFHTKCKIAETLSRHYKVVFNLGDATSLAG